MPRIDAGLAAQGKVSADFNPPSADAGWAVWETGALLAVVAAAALAEMEVLAASFRSFVAPLIEKLAAANSVIARMPPRKTLLLLL